MANDGDILSLIAASSYNNDAVGKWKQEHGLHLGTKAAIFSTTGLRIIAERIWSELSDLDPTLRAVAGDGAGGGALAVAVALVAQMSGTPIAPLHVRDAGVLRPNKNRIEGSQGLDRHTRVAVVDDTINTGKSVIRVIEALREAEFEVTTVIVLVARSDDIRKRLRKLGVDLVSIFHERDIERTIATLPNAMRQYFGR